MASAWEEYKKEHIKKPEATSSVSDSTASAAGGGSFSPSPALPKRPSAWEEYKSTHKMVRPSLNPARYDDSWKRTNDVSDFDYSGTDVTASAHINQPKTPGMDDSSLAPSVFGELGNSIKSAWNNYLDFHNQNAPKRSDFDVRVDNILAGAAKNSASNFISAISTLAELQAQNDLRNHTSLSDTALVGVFNKDLWLSHDRNMQEIYAEQVKGAQNVRDYSSKLAQEGQKQIEAQKEGLGTFGQTMVDLGAAGTQMVYDIGLGWLTGAGMAVPMAVRVFGSSAQKAKDEGATLEQQALYGVGAAAVAYGLEHLFNTAMASLKVVAPGIGDDVVKTAINKMVDLMAKTPKGATALRTTATLFASGLGEGFEEFMEAAIDPALQKLIYNPNAKTIFEDPSQLGEYLYEGFIGAILGLTGSGTNVMLNTGLDANADENVKKTYREYQQKFQDAITDEAIDDAYRALKDEGMFSNAGRAALANADTQVQRSEYAQRRMAPYSGVRVELSGLGEDDTKTTAQEASQSVSEEGNAPGGGEPENAPAAAETETGEDITNNPVVDGSDVRLSDGRIVSKEEFVSALRKQDPGMSNATVQRLYDSAVKHNRRGESYPAEIVLGNLEKALSATETAQGSAVPSTVPEPGDFVETVMRYNREQQATQAQQNEKTAAETQRSVFESNTDVKSDDTESMRVALVEQLDRGEITEAEYNERMESIEELESLDDYGSGSLDTYNPDMMRKVEVNTDGRSSISDDGSQRAESQSAREQAGTLAEGTGRYQSRQVQSQRAAGRRDDVSRYYESRGQQPVSARDYLGTGKVNKVSTVQEMPAEMVTNDAELNRIAEEIRTMGLTPRFYVGDARLRNGNSVDGLIRGKDVYIRVDGDVWTATQNWDHEKAHAILRQSPGIEARLYGEIVGRGEAARRKLHQTMQRYREAYHGIYDMDENGNEIWDDTVQEMILQEILADAYAGKDTFAKGVEEYADVSSDAVSQIENRGGEVRGPPDGAMSVVRDRKSVGGYRVIVDRDIFSGVPYDQRNRVLRDFLFENLRGAEIETLIDQNVLYIAQKNKDLQKLVRPGVPMKERKYNARQDIASHFDEVTAASKLDDIEKNKKPTERPNRGDVQKRIVEVEIPSWDNNGKLNDVSIWQVELSVPLDLISGNRTSYDISSLSDKTKNTHSLLYRLQKAGLDVDRVSLQRTIAENLKVVKPKVRENFSASISESNANELAKEHNELAVNYFGRTFKWAETGYILLDGRKLDFSGRHEGASGGYRTVDHRDIRDALGDDYGGDSYSGGMVQFMAEGNIRIEPESGGINLSVKPTKAQLDALSDFISKNRGEVILDLDDVNGNTLSSTEYPKGTHANKVLQDIKNWFENGEEPHVSELAQFRFSAGKAAQKSGADPIEAMPTKARQVMERAEKKLQRSLSDVLNLPKKMPEGVLEGVSREISREFLETGTVSDETIDRTFEQVYSAIESEVERQYGVDAEDYRQWAERDYIAEVAKHLAELRLVKRYAAEKAQQAARDEADTIMTLEELGKTYQDLKAARRGADKAVARNLLTESDERKVHALLRGDIDIDMLKPETDNVRGITEVYNAKLEYEKFARRIRRWNATRKGELRALADKLLESASDWTDKGAGWLYSRETMERNIRDIVPDKKVAQEVIDTLFKPVHDGAAAANKMKNEYRDRVRKLDLSRKVAKGNEISEAAAVQLLGEAEDNIRHLEQNRFLKERDGKSLEDWRGIVRDMWDQNPNLDAAKIRKAVKEFREIYDELFEQMNTVRMRNGYEPVNYRKGYFPHFQSKGGDRILGQFGKALGVNTAAMQLPTTINGLTHTFKPGMQWFGSAQQRMGVNTAFDAVEGFDSYIEGVADVINQTDNIQRLRAFAAQVRYRTSEEGIRKQVDAIQNDPTIAPEDKQNRIEKLYAEGKFELGNLAVELDEYTNLLAGKKSRHDRDMEQRLGRRMYAIMKGLEGRVAANMVAINPGSWLTNFIPITQGAATLDTRSLLSGMWDTLKAYKQNDGFVDASSFLTNRRGSDPLVRTWTQKASAKMSSPMELIDSFTADTLVRARYNENVRRGLSEAEAMADADAWAAGVMADRSKGAMPTLFSQTNPFTKLLTQFQLEVNNQLSYVFKDVPREMREKGVAALALALFKFMLGAYLYDEIYEYVIGRRPALDPLGIINDTVGDLTGYELPNLVELGVGAVKGEMPSFEVEKKDPYTAAESLMTATLEELPFIGSLMGGGRLPISSALPDWENLGKALLSDGWDPKKKWATMGKELAKPATYLALPFGGGQVKKIVEGGKAVIEGGSYNVNSAGEKILQYPVYNDTPGQAGINAVRAMLFGKSSLPTAQEWVESGFDSLGTKQTALYEDLKDAGATGEEAYQLIRDTEAADSNLDKIATIANSYLDEKMKLLAMSNAMSESQYEKYTSARAAGVSSADYAELLRVIAKNAAERGSKSTSQADVKAALQASDLTNKQKRAIWNSYGWKEPSPW